MPSFLLHLLPALAIAAACVLPAAETGGAWPEGKSDTWRGFTRRTFAVEGCSARVLEPATPAPGKPWAWCLEFPDASIERTGALTLVKEGYHYVHIAMDNSFGSPTALAHCSAFYQILRAHGLNQRAVLIGVSRGGLYTYRWASANPDKVAVIYGDAPVCDFKSWPGGKGKGSTGDWQRLQTRYGLADEAEALRYTGNPIDILAPLAAARIPIVHVVGDSDDVVPVAENTAIIEKRYAELGGTMQILHQPTGHHPHGLANPEPVWHSSASTWIWPCRPKRKGAEPR